MTDLMYAPSLMFAGVKVPPLELAREVWKDAVLLDRVPSEQGYITFSEDDGSLVVAFPMDGKDFLGRGCLLMEYFHSLCFGAHSADEGNEWLLFYRDPDGIKEGETSPADSMFAVLYLSDDEGQSWQDTRSYQVTRPRAEQ